VLHRRHSRQRGKVLKTRALLGVLELRGEAATDLMHVVTLSGATSHMLIDGVGARSGNLASIRQGESEVIDPVQMPGRLEAD
jgi:hypothetical protein